MEASIRLSYAISWSVSDVDEKMHGPHSKKSASGLAPSCDNLTLGDPAWSSSHKKCESEAGPLRQKEGDLPPLKVWTGAAER